MSWENFKWSESIWQNIEQQESLVKKLGYLKVDWLSEENFNQFIKSLENKKWSEYYNQIIDSLTDINNNDDVKEILLSYIKEEWYPLNKALNILIQDFGFEIKEDKEEIEEEIKEDKEEIKEDKEEIKEDKEEIKEKLELFLKENKGLLKSSEIGAMFVAVLENWTLKQASDFFNDNWEELLVVLAHTNSKLFEETRKFAVESLWIKGLKKIEHYQWIERSKSEDWKSQKFLWASVKTLEKESVEGKAVAELDLNHVPPKYSLSALDSDYKMETKLDSKDISEATDSYLEAEWISNDWMQNLDWFSDQFWNMVDKIKSIRVESSWAEWQEESRMKLKSIVNSFKITLLGYLTNIYDNISDIPEWIKITEQDISSIWNNPADFMVNISNVSNKLNLLKEFISNIPVWAYKKYEDKLKEVVENDVKNKDVQIKTLNFLKSIGFDWIDKTITDWIIDLLNSNNWLRKQYWFTWEIDLMKWNLWTNKDWDLNKITFEEKKIFIEFVNLMISWEKDIPNHLTSWWEIQFFENKQDMESWNVSWVNRKSFINWKLWMSPDSRIKKNLWLID